MISPPSTETPRRPPPIPLGPLPSARTSVVPYSWLRRHSGAVAAVAPVITGGAAWAAGAIQGVDPIKAFQQLGAPVACLVLLAAALAWTYLIYIPQREASAERTRQLLMEADATRTQEIVASHAEDRAAWLTTTQEQASEARQIRGVLEELARRMGHLEGRLEEAIGEVPTNPGTPATTRQPPPIGGRYPRG